MSSKTFSVDSNNDLYLTPLGNLAIAVDIESVKENCAHIMQTLLGECVLDLQYGLPNFQTIWRSGALLPQYNAAAINSLRKVDGVSGVVAFDSAIIDGSLNYQATIKTIYGEASINGL